MSNPNPKPQQDCFEKGGSLGAANPSTSARASGKRYPYYDYAVEGLMCGTAISRMNVSWHVWPVRWVLDAPPSLARTNG